MIMTVEFPSDLRSDGLAGLCVDAVFVGHNSDHVHVAEWYNADVRRQA